MVVAQSNIPALRADAVRKFYAALTAFDATQAKLTSMIAAQAAVAGAALRSTAGIQAAEARRAAVSGSKRWVEEHPTEEGANMQRVASTCFAAIGYDSAKEQLFLAFVNGGIYMYSGVPNWVAENMLRSASHGRQFWRDMKLRNPVRDRYPATRIG